MNQQLENGRIKGSCSSCYPSQRLQSDAPTFLLLLRYPFHLTTKRLRPFTILASTLFERIFALLRYHQTVLLKMYTISFTLLGREFQQAVTVANLADTAAIRLDTCFLEHTFSQLKSMPKLPRARKPLICPVGQASGKEGRRSIKPA